MWPATPCSCHLTAKHLPSNRDRRTALPLSLPPSFLPSEAAQSVPDHSKQEGTPTGRHSEEFSRYLLLLLVFGLASVASSGSGVLRRDGRDLVQWHAHPSLWPGLSPYGSESPLAESFWAIDFKLGKMKRNRTELDYLISNSKTSTVVNLSELCWQILVLQKG